MKSFLLILALSSSIQFCFSQVNLLAEFSQKGKKIFIITESEKEPETFDSIVKNHFSNLSRWKICNQINEADMVIVFSGYPYAGYGVDLYECYAKIFDNKMNFLYRTGNRFKCKGGTVNSPLKDFMKICSKDLIYDLPAILAKAEISKISPLYKSDVKKSLKDNSKQKLVEMNYNLAVEAIEDKLNKDALKHLNECIKLDPDTPEFYEMRGIVYMQMEKGKEAMKDFEKLQMLSPLYKQADLYRSASTYLYAANVEVKVERAMRFAAIGNIITTSLNNIAGTMPPVTNNVLSGPTQYQQSQSGLTKTEICSFCKGTGINPVATSVASFSSDGYHHCNVCKEEVPDSHGYHGDCPSCNGKGSRIRIR